MQTLEKELEDLIALTKEYLSSRAPAASTSASTSSAPAASSSTSKAAPAAASRPKAAPSSQPKVQFKAGDECSCRYTDGKWYAARITQISGSADQPVYTVVYKGYDTPEVVTASDLRPSFKWDSGSGAGGGSGPAAGEKRKAAAEPSKEDLEKERKKKKNEKKTETLKARTEEQAAKQKGWQAFAKKGSKKGIHIPGVKGTSPLLLLTVEPGEVDELTLRVSQERVSSGRRQKATRTPGVR